MRKCTFKLMDKNTGKVHSTYQYYGYSYVDGVIKACEFFKTSSNISDSCLRTTAKFKDRVMSIDDLTKIANQLNSVFANCYIKRQGVNDQSEIYFDDEVLLIIVGSAIPQYLKFFYTGDNNKVFGWIDKQKGTNLKQLAISGDCVSLKEELNKLHVLFFDIADYCLHYNGSSSDDDILGYTIDANLFDKIKQSNAKIVSATGNARDFLIKVLNIDNRLYSLMAYSKEEPWVELINSVLK